MKFNIFLVAEVGWLGVNPVVLIASYSETETGPGGTVTTKELVGLIRQLWPQYTPVQSVNCKADTNTTLSIVLVRVQQQIFQPTKFHLCVRSVDSGNSISTQ